MAYMEKESKKMDIYIYIKWLYYVTDSLCCTPETYNIVNQLYSNLKKIKRNISHVY